MTTKTDIKNSLKLIERYGGKLYTFNSNRYTGTGFKGFPDHILFYKGYEIFVEVKIGKDKISAEQIIFKNHIKEVTGKNPFVFYLVATEKNYTLITDYLMQEKIIQLRNFK